MLLKKSVYIFFLVAVLVAALVQAAPFRYYMPAAQSDQDSKTFINILNTNDDKAELELTIYYEKNDTQKKSLSVDPHSSKSFDLSGFATGSFGAVVSSDKSIVVDSVLYDTTYSGGFGSLAAVKPGFVWYFGEGYSSGMVKTYLYIINPDVREANIEVTLYYDSGEKKTFDLLVPAQKHIRFDLKEKTLPEKRFGIKVTSQVPVAVAAGNFNKHFSAGSGGVGAQELSKLWYFPDGYTSTEATEFINLVNPSGSSAKVKLTLYYLDGSTTSFDEIIPANSKKMLMLNNYAAEFKWFSTVVESDVKIMAESTHYDQSYSAGQGGPGATAVSKDHYFAYGLSSSMTQSYLAVFNPSVSDADLVVSFFYSDGSVKSFEQKAAALARTNIDLEEKAIKDRPFGMHISSSEMIVAKIAVYSKSFSAGHGYIGMQELLSDNSASAASGEEEPVFSEEAESRGFVLLKEEILSPEKFKAAFRKGLKNVIKQSYDHDGSDVVAWHFSYEDKALASEALNELVSGGLFEVLEFQPVKISGMAAHELTTPKSKGYAVLTGNEILLSLSEPDKAELALELAESSVLENPAVLVEDESNSLTLAKILLILVFLVIFAFFVSRLFRRKEEDAVWEEMIPSAKPKTKKDRKKSGKKHQAMKKNDGVKNADKEKADDLAVSDQKKEIKNRKDDDHNKKTEIRAEKKSESREDKKAEAKHYLKTEKKITESLKKKPDSEKTAQDFLDEAGNIYDYEDVFRHVNRDYEEIKPK